MLNVLKQICDRQQLATFKLTDLELVPGIIGELNRLTRLNVLNMVAPNQWQIMNMREALREYDARWQAAAMKYAVEQITKQGKFRRGDVIAGEWNGFECFTVYVDNVKHRCVFELGETPPDWIVKRDDPWPDDFAMYRMPALPY